MDETSVIAFNTDGGKSEISRRALSNTTGKTLFTNSELHILLDSVLSTMDSYTLGKFTSVCEAFIQDNLKMPGLHIVHFNVIVTRQALLESELRNLFQGLRRTTELGGKLLALSSVVTTKYTSSEGDLIDPSDFHRYLRLLVNTRGSDFANELESTGIPYFRNISNVLTYSSAVKSQPSEDQPSGSSEQGLTDDTPAESTGTSSWAIVIMVIGATAVVLVTVMIIRRLHVFLLTTTQFIRKKQQSPFSVVELSEYLDVERSNIVDAPTCPSTNLDYDRCSTRGHSDFSASPRIEIDDFKNLEGAKTWLENEEMEVISRNEPNHSHSPISPCKTDAISLQAIPQHPMEALGNVTPINDAVSTCIEADSNSPFVPMCIVKSSQHSDFGSNVNPKGMQEKHSVVSATSDRLEAKRKTSIRKTNRRGRKARKQKKGASNNMIGASPTRSSVSRGEAPERQPSVEDHGLSHHPNAIQPLTLTKNPIITMQSSSYGVYNESLSSISESDSEVD
jgi:hypothetical protein